MIVPITKFWKTPREESVDSLGSTWQIGDLRAAVANQPVFELPMAHIAFSDYSFDNDDLIDFARHMLHVHEADLQYPVIMNHKGRIIDGRHRLVRALLEGREFVLCQRLPEDVQATYSK